MLAEIGNAKHVQSAVDKAKDKESGFRLMGFGHRVYKNFDPRAKIIREMCHQVLDELGVDDPMLEVAMRLEEAALKDDYFVQRKLYPNVDFYSRSEEHTSELQSLMLNSYAVFCLQNKIQHKNQTV